MSMIIGTNMAAIFISGSNTSSVYTAYVPHLSPDKLEKLMTTNPVGIVALGTEHIVFGVSLKLRVYNP